MLMRFHLGLWGLIASAAVAGLAAAQEIPPPPTETTPPAVTMPAAATMPAANRVRDEKTAAVEAGAVSEASAARADVEHVPLDYMSMVFVFMLATFIGIGVIRRVSRLLHTPLMSLTNAISAIAVVGAIIVAGMEPHDADRPYPGWIRLLGSIAVVASMTNIISGFLITDRMLKMFKTKQGGPA